MNGISGNLFKQITDYLTDKTIFKNKWGSSETKPIKYGVPQGSLLGLRLFGFHANDLPDSVEFGEVEMFADDIQKRPVLGKQLMKYLAFCKKISQ